MATFDFSDCTNVTLFTHSVITNEMVQITHPIVDSDRIVPAPDTFIQPGKTYAVVFECTKKGVAALRQFHRELTRDSIRGLTETN